MSPARFLPAPLLASFVLAACGSATVAPRDGSPVDATVDASLDAPAAIDATEVFTDAADASADASVDDGSDAARSFPARPGCNADGGIECDGDWDGRCLTPCGPTECCSPQRGHFTCVPMGDDGFCPAADLWVDASKIASGYSVGWQYFAPTDCALVEHCVDAPGWRRLLHFPTWTPNTGTSDMYLGRPINTNGYFEYSACHMHYHFNTYAQYTLSGGDGGVAARGHKQAFCLEDFYQYPGTSNAGAVYTCNNQGIERGWQDVYGTYLDCQWIDVTDTPQGSYSLEVDLNTAHVLNESDYSNNSAVVPVTIPPDDGHTDPTGPCATATEGVDRACGWTREGTHTCTPDTAVEVGCSNGCNLGSCTGDTVLRVCDGDGVCGIADTLAYNDDSGCGTGQCGPQRNTECCSLVRFRCPASGTYTVEWGAYNSANAANTTCNIAVSP